MTSGEDDGICSVLVHTMSQSNSVNKKSWTISIFLKKKNEKLAHLLACLDYPSSTVLSSHATTYMKKKRDTSKEKNLSYHQGDEKDGKKVISRFLCQFFFSPLQTWRWRTCSELLSMLLPRISRVR